MRRRCLDQVSSCRLTLNTEGIWGSYLEFYPDDPKLSLDDKQNNCPLMIYLKHWSPEPSTATQVSWDHLRLRNPALSPKGSNLTGLQCTSERKWLLARWWSPRMSLTPCKDSTNWPFSKFFLSARAWENGITIQYAFILQCGDILETHFLWCCQDWLFHNWVFLSKTSSPCIYQINAVKMTYLNRQENQMFVGSGPGNHLLWHLLFQ